MAGGWGNPDTSGIGIPFPPSRTKATLIGKESGSTTRTMLVKGIAMNEDSIDLEPEQAEHYGTECKKYLEKHRNVVIVGTRVDKFERGTWRPVP